MKKNGYYSSGEFANMAQVTIRTIRYYDKQNILKPSYVSETGARYYTDEDFAKLQQILLLKYLGFSLDDIKEMTIGEMDYHFLINSLNLQKQLVEDRIEQMHLVADAIESTVDTLSEHGEIDWTKMLDLIHLTGMEKSLKSQYQNANNLSARIRLHSAFSINKKGWFPWLFEECVQPVLSCQSPDNHAPLRILEVGCGNGALWTENYILLKEFASATKRPVEIVLTDISEGMIRDVRRSIHGLPGLSNQIHFSFQALDCHRLPYNDASFDLVLANHVLFYCDDIPRVLGEIARVKKSSGTFCCSTYGSAHMREITDLVQEFDNRIVLSSGDKLYERFGLDNGAMLLQSLFHEIQLKRYEDEIVVNQAEPLIEYILSCHGNQNQFLLDRYHDFRSFTEQKVQDGFHIAKDAGFFLCK